MKLRLDFLGGLVAARMSESTIQQTLACCMFLPGAACVLAPRKLLQLSLRQEKRNEITDTTLLIFQFFGMQACLVGTVLGTCKMTQESYRAFAAAMIPFFGINYYYHFVKPTIAPLPMLADFINNVVMSQIALAGALLLGSKNSGTQQQ